MDKWRKEDFEVPTGKFSIHSKREYMLHGENTEGRQLADEGITEGYKPQFSAQPPRYRERGTRLTQ